MKPAIQFILLLLLPLFLFSTCKKNRNTDPANDHIIVGWGGGIASLANYYLIADGQLRKDTVHTRLSSVPQDNAQFKFDYVQPDSLYKKVADLKARIPQEMLDHNNRTYGEAWPDGGYKEVRTTINGIQYRWTFEIDQSKSSPAVQAFCKLLVLN